MLISSSEVSFDTQSLYKLLLLFTIIFSKKNLPSVLYSRGSLKMN